MEVVRYKGCKMTTEHFTEKNRIIYDFKLRDDRIAMDKRLGIYISVLPNKIKNDIPIIIQLYTIHQLNALFTKDSIIYMYLTYIEQYIEHVIIYEITVNPQAIFYARLSWKDNSNETGNGQV